MYFRATGQSSSRARDVDNRRNQNRSPQHRSQPKEYRDNSTPPRSRGKYRDRRQHSREHDRYHDQTRDLPHEVHNEPARGLSPKRRVTAVPKHQPKPTSPDDSRRNAGRAERYLNDPANETDDDLNRYLVVQY